jgi:DNA primase
MNTWEDIKSRLSILDVIGDYVEVRQVGSSYKCLCPFHNDKNPSLTISPEKGLWHCFGCGAGGDMFKFVTDFENISKAKALEKLAKKAGVELDKQKLTKKTDPQTITRRQKGLDYLSWVTTVYHKTLRKVLTSKNQVSQYVHSRNLDQKTISEFALGYAPSGGFLLNLARKYNLDLELLEAIGVLKKTDSGSFKDKFSDRLMIPIKDQFDNVVGFTGRIIVDNKDLQRPKYLNSPQTEWFSKSQVWFGLNLHQKTIRQARQAIILEGNMDVIASHQHGLNLTLASQGTSVTSDHLRKLKNFTSKLILAFDNDEAGIAAERKLTAGALGFGFEVDKLQIPTSYKDLDDWIQDKHLDFQSYPWQQHSKPFLEVLIDRHMDGLGSRDINIQQKSLSIVLEVLKPASDFIKEHYLQILSQITKKSLATLNSQLNQARDLSSQQLTVEHLDTDIRPNTELHNHIITAWQNLLTFYFADKDLWQQDQVTKADWKGLEACFIIFRELLPKLTQNSNLDSYIQEHQEHLRLLKSAKAQELVFLKNQLRQYIANNYSKINTNPGLLEAYQVVLEFLA